MKKQLLALAVAANAAFGIQAADYYLVGGFNSWNTSSHQLISQSDGTYTLDVEKLTPEFKICENKDWHPMWGAESQTDNRITPGTPFKLVCYQEGDPFNLLFTQGIDQLSNAHVVFNPTESTITVTGKTDLPDYYITGSMTKWKTPGDDGTYLLKDDGTGVLSGEIVIEKQDPLNPTRFQIGKYLTWDGMIGLDKSVYGENKNGEDFKVTVPATDIKLAQGGSDIYLNVTDGIYKVSFNYAKMTLDMVKTGDIKPDIPEYYLTGSMTKWSWPGKERSIKFEDYGNGKIGTIIGIYSQNETDQTRFQICKFDTWDGAIGLDKSVYGENKGGADFKVTAPATDIKLAQGGSDIYLDVENGAYTVIFDYNAMTLSIQKYDNGVTEDGLAVFTGNSICDYWGSNDPSLFNREAIINVGVAGETSQQILDRFDRDVMTANPGVVVIISPSTNDIAQNQGPVTHEKMVDNVRQMILKVKQSRAANPQVILTSNLPCNYFFWKPDARPAAEIMEVNTLLEALAVETGAKYVDLHTPMADNDNALKTEYSDDGCHPNQSGYEVMKTALMPAVEEARTVVSALQTIGNDLVISTSAAKYYNINGTEVNNPQTGIYIRVCGDKVEKVVIK